jgi:hypothetical protein
MHASSRRACVFDRALDRASRLTIFVSRRSRAKRQRLASDGAARADKLQEKLQKAHRHLQLVDAGRSWAWVACTHEACAADQGRDVGAFRGFLTKLEGVPNPVLQDPAGRVRAAIRLDVMHVDAQSTAGA